MELKKVWQHWLLDIDKTGADVARDIGQSPANLNKKIANASIRAVELDEILRHYGYKLQIVKGD